MASGCQNRLTQRCVPMFWNITHTTCMRDIVNSWSCSTHLSTVASMASPGKGFEQDVTMKYENAKRFSEIPEPKGLPFLGTALRYRLGPYKIERVQDALWDDYRKYGPIVKETIMGQTSVHLFDPDFLKTYYYHESKLPDVPPLLETAQLYRKQRQLSPGLGNINGEEWYRLRSAVQQVMMRPAGITAFFPLVEPVADDFVKRVEKMRDENGEVANFRHEVAKWSVESAAATVFETRLGCLEPHGNAEAEGLIEDNTRVFEMSALLKFSLPLYKYLPLPKWQKLVNAEDSLQQFGLKLINQALEKISSLEKRNELSKNKYIFLSYLLSRKELDYKDICAISMSLFTDPLSTTSPMLIYNLYCLAKNPDVQEKLNKEIESYLPGDTPLTANILGSMPYLRGCVKETFRFFPVGLDISRLTKKDMVIGGYQIPAGTRVDMNNFLMGLLPEYFPDVEKFIPDRWIKDGSAVNLHPHIMIPFGHGPRMCAGRRFAEQELYLMLTKLVKKFRIEWHHGEMGQKYQILMVPDCPARFSFKSRN